MNSYLRVLFSAIALAVCLPSFAQLSRANKDYELGAYNLAVRSYLELLEKRPANYEAMVLLADSYRYLNQMEEARSWYEKVIQESKLEGEHLFNYAQVLMALEQYDKAKQWFLAYARVNKDDAERGNHYANNCGFAQNQVGLSSPYLVSNEPVNTTSSDYGAAFVDGQVAFSSARADLQSPGTSWTGKSNNQLFLARIGSEGFLEAPVPMQGRLREGFTNIGPIAYYPEGRTIAFTKNNFIDGTRHIPNGGLNLSLFTAQVNSNGEWVEEKPFPHNGSGFSTGWPSISPDGNALYFASDRPEGFGGFDLYVSYRMGNTWSTPENLGPNINSAGNEVTPFFDGEYLFFSSDWHAGLGGYDIFRAEQANCRWMRIFHLGNVVNSSRDDMGFVYDNTLNIGYLTSNRPGGKGNEDIYKAYMSAENIVLSVRNASDGTPVPYATIDFGNCGKGVFRTDARGNFTFQAVERLNCEVAVQAEGYSVKRVALSTLGLQNKREMNIMLSRPGEEYRGTVLNYSNRMPINGASVTVTNQSTGGSAQVTTDQSGAYVLALAPNSAYLVRYSHPGFRDINRPIQTDGGQNRDILGVISMLPSSMAGSGDTGAGERSVGNGEGGTATGPVIASGYAVQVAALSKPGLENFAGLANLGQVYSKFEDNKYKVRVGVFQDKSEAGRVLQSVKAKGYKGAFITTEEGNAGSMQPRSVGNLQEPATGNQGITGSQRGQYLVQLAAYKDPRWFDASGLEGYGTIQDMERNGLTIKYLGFYGNIEEAKQAWQRARSAGFSTAFIVVDAGGGELRKVYP